MACRCARPGPTRRARRRASGTLRPTASPKLPSGSAIAGARRTARPAGRTPRTGWPSSAGSAPDSAPASRPDAASARCISSPRASALDASDSQPTASGLSVDASSANAREEQVARRGGGQPTALGEHRRAPAPQRRAVEHVVVYERGHAAARRRPPPAARRGRRSRRNTSIAQALAAGRQRGRRVPGQLGHVRRLRGRVSVRWSRPRQLGPPAASTAPSWAWVVFIACPGMDQRDAAGRTQRTSSSPAATSRSASSAARKRRTLDGR